MLRIRADWLVTPTEVLAGGVLVIDGERIVGVEARSDADVVLSGMLVPGYVDIHTHGAGGADYGDPTTDPRTALAAQRVHGETSVVASLATGPLDVMAARVDELAGLVESGELAGIHLEGPCLAPAACGAHHPDLLRGPEVLSELVAAGRGSVRVVTIAPELPGALDVIEALAQQGIVPAIGHTTCDAATARAAIQRGASLATHLFNAMPPIHQREPGPVPVALTDQQVTVELIADGVHVAPEVLALAIQAHPGRVCLVTDSMAATALGDGDYLLGALTARVCDGVARVLLPGDGDGPASGPIAGSTLTLDRAVVYVVRELGLDLGTAVQMATAIPARALGLTDVGYLAPGCFADACLVTAHGELTGVLRHGQWVSPPEIAVTD